ncbi:MAG: DNA translocase FtsK 4TM domain-containing protein [Proteobacteria bacterium]|nr:DNA translocase FtsK 4TM domain-containing protein [Pseudomonadota bacterium]
MARTLVRGAPLMPEAAARFLRRRLMELIGAILFGTALAGTLALASYSPADPSVNSATSGPTANLLGHFGAATADLLVQWLGLASWLPTATLAVWGMRLISGHVLTHFVRKIGWLVLATLALSVALGSFVPARGLIPDFPMGGAIGRLAFENLMALAGAWPWLADALGGARAAVVASLLLALGLCAAIAAIGMSAADWLATMRSLRAGGSKTAKLLARGGRAAAAGVQGLRERVEPHIGTVSAQPDAAPLVRAPVEPADDEDDDALDAEERPASNPRRLVAERASTAKPGRRAKAERQRSLDLDRDEAWRAPPLELLNELERGAAGNARPSQDALEQNARLLESVLEDFGVKGEIVKVRPGPVVTLYEFEPAAGTKTSRVVGLADDIARSMSAVSVRIASIPGRNVIGLELPNARRETVSMRELLESETIEKTAGMLKLALGKDIGGTPVVVDLARMPHLLIAGTTGSGKSVAINTMILTLLYQQSPKTCRFIMIDPKMLELSVYDGIPHLLCPVVTEPGKAVVALKWTVREMEDRYRVMSQLGVRNIAGYNARIEEATRKNETLTRRVQTGFEADTGKPVFEDQPLAMDPLPLIVVVVDEMADLMLVAGKDIEGAVQRLSQMARAAGIHLIMATQRPSVDVITGTIKANFPTRISFQVTSKIDSRTILGEQGAEQLLGQGDMLYMAGGGRISRVHGPFVSDQEVERVVSHLKAQGLPQYLESITEEPEAAAFGTEGVPEGSEALYQQAVDLIKREGKASTSFIQRHLQIGYNRAARLVERMEAEGLVSPADRVGRREVLVGGGRG